LAGVFAAAGVFLAAGAFFAGVFGSGALVAGAFFAAAFFAGAGVAAAGVDSSVVPPLRPDSIGTTDSVTSISSSSKRAHDGCSSGWSKRNSSAVSPLMASSAMPCCARIANCRVSLTAVIGRVTSRVGSLRVSSIAVTTRPAAIRAG
jgi:hypothetical protein